MCSFTLIVVGSGVQYLAKHSKAKLDFLLVDALNISGNLHDQVAIEVHLF